MSIGKEWELLTTVSVDSGQLMLVDPGYIDMFWQNRPFRDIRRYQRAGSGRVLRYGVDFDRFDTVMPEFGKSMNDLIDSEGWKQIDEPIPNGLDYEAACLTTLQKEKGGQVGGLAAAFSTGYGDGEYPVYVKRRGGRIAQVLIDFGVEDDA